MTFKEFIKANLTFYFTVFSVPVAILIITREFKAFLLLMAIIITGTFLSFFDANSK